MQIGKTELPKGYWELLRQFIRDYQREAMAAWIAKGTTIQADHCLLRAQWNPLPAECRAFYGAGIAAGVIARN